MPSVLCLLQFEFYFSFRRDSVTFAEGTPGSPSDASRLERCSMFLQCMFFSHGSGKRSDSSYIGVAGVTVLYGPALMYFALQVEPRRCVTQAQSTRKQNRSESVVQLPRAEDPTLTHSVYEAPETNEYCLYLN